MINRRDVLRSAVAAIALVPLRAAAQRGLPTIGYLAASDTALRAQFLDGLKQAGFIAGQNVAIEYRFAEGQP
jgi:putative ABC transport system substrate-binding protein